MEMLDEEIRGLSRVMKATYCSPIICVGVLN